MGIAWKLGGTHRFAKPPKFPHFVHSAFTDERVIQALASHRSVTDRVDSHGCGVPLSSGRLHAYRTVPASGETLILAGSRTDPTYAAPVLQDRWLRQRVAAGRGFGAVSDLARPCRLETEGEAAQARSSTSLMCMRNRRYPYLPQLAIARYG
jgi:hypothetical protein